MHPRHPLTLLALLSALLLVGCRKETPIIEPGVDPQPSKDATAKDKKTVRDSGKRETPPKVDPPPVSVSALALTEAFLTDAKKAEAKYKDKLLAVEGTVASARQNKVQKMGEVTLRGHTPKPDPDTGASLPLQVKCHVKPAVAGRVGLLGKGQRVLVTGRISNVSAGDVTMMDCVFEEQTRANTSRVAAEDISKQYASDKEEAAKKYQDKELIVRGTVEDLIAKDGNFSVKLAGADKVRVACSLEEDEFKTLKKGDKVVIKGEVALFDSGEVVVTSAFLLPPNS
jgi:hypothetical protein